MNLLYCVFICRRGGTGSNVNGVSDRGDRQHGLKVTVKSMKKKPRRLMKLAHGLWMSNLFFRDVNALF